jgi:eukaryotic-like serine/threonine-protein kinase
MARKVVRLNKDWLLGNQIGGGGFGKVYEATHNDEWAVAKLIPKAPGADRELLFVDLGAAVNIVPVVDSGEYGHSWVLIMPRADKSLRQHLSSTGGLLDLAATLEVLSDVVSALVSIEGRIVHRDLKPENVLHLDGSWCLSDFGISRYAEATTAPDTLKYAMSAAYAAPERWRHERATSAADVYALGIMAFEMLTGVKPFRGQTWEDLQQQHLHDRPPSLGDVSMRLGAAIEECLLKEPGARPTATNLRARLEALRAEPSASAGLMALGEANREALARLSEQQRRESHRRSIADTRAGLAAAGLQGFVRISTALLSALTTAAPTAQTTSSKGGGWALSLGSADLSLKQPQPYQAESWGGRWDPPAFDVVLAAKVSLRIPPRSTEYEGRSHSLWYCDAEQDGEFAWFETAFMISAFVPRRGRQNPFALDPGAESAQALGTAIAQYQLAWPFTRLLVGELEEFVDRWAGWLGLASRGGLSHPINMPEKAGTEGSFRR